MPTKASNEFFKFDSLTEAKRDIVCGFVHYYKSPPEVIVNCVLAIKQ